MRTRRWPPLLYARRYQRAYYRNRDNARAVGSEHGRVGSDGGQEWRKYPRPDKSHGRSGWQRAGKRDNSGTTVLAFSCFCWAWKDQNIALHRVVPRHEFIDAIDLVIRQAVEHPCEPCFGINVIHLGGFDEGIGDGSGFSTWSSRCQPRSLTSLIGTSAQSTGCCSKHQLRRWRPLPPNPYPAGPVYRGQFLEM